MARKIKLRLPRRRATAGAQAPAVDDGVVAAYWHAHLGASAQTSTWAIAKRAPKVIIQVAAMAWRASRRSSIAVGAGTVASAIISGFALVQSVRVISVLFATDFSAALVGASLPAIALLAALYTVGAMADAFVSFGQADLQPKIKRLAERDLYTVTARVKVAAFDDKDFADRLQRAADMGVVYAQQSVATSVEVVSASLSMLSAGSVLTYLHPALLPLIVLAVIPSWVASVRSAKLEYYSRLRYSSLNRRQWILAWHLVSAENMAELLACAAGPMLYGEHAQISDAIRDERARLGREQARVAAIGRGLSGVGTALVYAALVWMLEARWLPLARGLGAAMAVRTVRGSVQRFVLAIHGLFEQSLWIGDLDDWIAEAETLMPRVTGTAAPERFETLELRGVGFTYPEAEKAALAEVSVSVRTGEVIALVGRNGAGKTTLTKIIAGLLEPTEGSVCWDGREITDYDADTVAGRVAVCPQDPTLWPISARANIGVCEPDPRSVLDARVREASADAGAADVIEALAHTYDTVLSARFDQGTTLSGGQRAKVAIARGLYRAAGACSVLILDEPTANLDPIAEAETYRMVMSLRESREIAIVLVSHRLGAVVGADRIYVFEDGRVIEAGTHDRLLAADGSYARMYRTQAEMYTHEQSRNR